MSPTLRKALRLTLMVALVGAVGYFFASTLASNWERVQGYDLRVGPAEVSSLFFFAGSVVVSGWLWQLVLRALGERHIGWWSATAAHLGSWVVRYIPSVAQPLFKVNWASKEGVRTSVGFLAFFYEFALMQTGSILGAIVAIVIARAELITNESLVVYGGLLVLAAVAGLVAIRYLVNPVVTKIAKMRKMDDVRSLPHMSLVAIARLVGGYTLPRVVNGVGVGFLAVSILPAGTTFWDLVTIAAAYTIASAIGVWAVFVPSGIGVREAAFVAIVSALGVSVVDAITISIVVRLYSTFADGIVAALYGAMRLRLRRRP